MGSLRHPLAVLSTKLGKFRSLNKLQWRWLTRRQAVDPVIGHMKADQRMDRCWLQGATGDGQHASSCAVGYNVRWLHKAKLDTQLKQ